MNQENERQIFATLIYDVAHQLDINWTEYVFLDLVYHLSAKYGYCYMSNTKLSERLRMSFNGFRYMRERLIARELLIQVNNGLKVTDAYLDVAYSKNHYIPSEISQSETISKSEMNRGELSQKVRHISKSSDKKYSKELNTSKKSPTATFDKLRDTLQSKARYSDAYSKLIQKALKGFSEDELVQAAKHFHYKFHGGSQWHTANQRFATLKQFLGNDKDGVPRYQTYYEDSLQHKDYKKHSAQIAANNANPNLKEFFPS